jgi:hypothetical protein
LKQCIYNNLLVSLLAVEIKVLKLRKALYGLTQASRAWNAKLDKELIAFGFVKSKLEHAVYRRSSKKSFLLVGGVC